MTAVPEYNSKEWFEKLFFDYAEDYDLTDTSDRMAFWRRVTLSIERLGVKGIRQTFGVKGNTYRDLGVSVAQQFIGDNLDRLSK